MTILFEPTQIGRYTVRNRIFMAPMSRYRAHDNDINPDIAIEYYRQRASAGLIVAESTTVNDWAGGINCPGIYNVHQAQAWKKVTDAVHEEGGVIFLQLWHCGRASHASLMPTGRDVVAPSAIASTEEVMTASGMQTPTPPREISKAEILELRQDYAQASRYALDAGFDGIEIHAAGGFIIDTFLQESTNQRDDEYGGSLENRYRFLGQVMDDAVSIWGPDRVGIKLSPTSKYNDVGEGDILTTFSYVISQLNKYGLAFLEVNEQMPFTSPEPEQLAITNKLRSLWTGVYIANGNYTAETGAKLINDGKATAISYGRFFLANPDLPARFKQHAVLNDVDMTTVYGGDGRGYIDYPTLPNG